MGFGKDGKGVIIRESRSQALGAIAQDAAILVGTNLATLERFRMLKCEIVASVVALTSPEGASLLLFLVDGDLSLAEAEAAIEANGPLGPNDTVAAATAERLVLLVGAIGQIESSAGVEALMKDMNNNAPVCQVKPRWTFSRTKSWNWLVYNNGTAVQTGATIRIKAKSFGVWVT